MSIEFWKYEGLGNDFIVVDTRRWPAETRAAIDGATARRLCDRHFGIGADGVLRLDPPNHPEDALAAMVVLNADGSTAEMCGNGLRCVARFLGDRGEVPTDGRLTIDTGAGPLPCRLGHDTVSVSLGAVTDDGRVTLELDGEAITGRVLHLGNPHLVLEPAGDRTAAGRFGAAAQAHPRFSGGVNVSSRRFTTDRAVDLWVWERGCGPTLACGTGAGATVAAAWLDGTVPMGAPVAVTLPGGRLTISGDLSGLVLEGPARAVYRGVVD
jgi:diaminopimelate epimerase